MATWERYEDAARAVIAKFKEYLGLERVEAAKKEYQGAVESWNIEVAGYREGDNRLVVFECRRRKRNVEKGEMGAFEHVIRDLGAQGYVVSQENLSKGARRIAEYHGIIHIPFRWDEKTGDYFLKVLNDVFIQITDRAGGADFAIVKLVPPEQNVT